jgi:cytochrome c oxidase subunit 4
MTRAVSGARVYVVVWLTLLVLAALTLTLSGLDLGWAAIPIALAIALFKAGIIAVYFMHAREQGTASPAWLAVGALFVALVVGLIVGDVALRDPRADLEPESATQEGKRPSRS